MLWKKGVKCDVNFYTYVFFFLNDTRIYRERNGEATDPDANA